MGKIIKSMSLGVDFTCISSVSFIFKSTYSKQAIKVDLMGYIDLKINRLRAYNRANGRYERMKKLKATKSAPVAPPQPQQRTTATTQNVNQGTQHIAMNWELRQAAERGDAEGFISSLERVSIEDDLQLNVILEQMDYEGNTYLHVAAKFGRSELIGLVTGVYGSIQWLQKTNNNGDTAFHIAARAGHLAVLDLLMRRDKLFLAFQMEQKNNKGNTPLHEALLHNHHHLVDLLLYSWLSCSFSVNNEGKSPLYLSIEAGNEKTFNVMLKAVHWTSTNMEILFEENLMKGKSLLHAAIFRKDKVMLQEVLAKGMHMLVYVKDENGETPIEFATRIGFEEGENILRNELSKDTTNNDAFGVHQQTRDQNPDVLESAAWDGRHERMRKLLMLPQQQNGIMSHYHCMDLGLYESTKTGDVDEFICALEKYSMERNVTLTTIISQLTPLKNTFLHVASRNGRKDLSWLIICYFPSLLCRKNHHGNMALHLAAQHGHLDIVKIFVAHRNDQLRTANINLNIHGVADMMQMVVENDDGRTPLQLAHIHHKDKVVDFFIEEHVEEAYHVNKKGSSFLYITIISNHTETLQKICNTVSHYVDQNVLEDQLIKGKALVLAAIWSQNIEMLQAVARLKPELLKIKDEHAQKLVHFAEYLGFHQGANYLRSEFKLEIVLGSTISGVISRSPLDSYSLDTYSLSVIDMVDPKIENIRQSMHLNRRYERMEKLLFGNSLQHISHKDQHEQHMDIALYEAAKKGDVDLFIGALEAVSEANNCSLHTISKQTTHIGNTFLHVAASYGNEDLTSFIVYYFRNLLTMESDRGNNTANHLAARAGHCGVVDILVRFINYHHQLNVSREYDVPESTYGTKCATNIEWNTSLQEAFVNNHRHVIEYLSESKVEEAFHVNSEGKSGLYLAVEAGMVDVVMTILTSINSDVNEKFISEFTNGKSLINAATKRRSTVMLQEILRQIPAQLHVMDEDGQTPLFYAVSTGFLEGLNCLLDEFKMDTSLMDSSGFYPVHVASKKGHVHILEKLMQNCPDAAWFRTHKEQNILHVAAMYGKDNVVRFILQTPDLAFLINEIDKDGNTPLHLATINLHPKIVSSLTWDHRVKLTSVNKDGLTALDAIEQYMEPMTSFQERLTWSALMSVCTPRSGNKDMISSKKHNLSENDERYNVDYSKDRVNTLLLVATLIATVTFSAGFTMPGGYNGSKPKQGHATLLRKHMLQTFVICDAIALYCAIMVAVTLIWAQLGDLALAMNALRFALPLLGLSLTTMSIAFLAGVSVVVGDLTWLADMLLIFGIISITCVLTIFIPLLFSYSSTSTFMRYITYYPFRLLVLASNTSASSDDQQIKEH